MLNRQYCLFLCGIMLVASLSVKSQESSVRSGIIGARVDSLKKSGFILNEEPLKKEIQFSTEQAVRFLQNMSQPVYWKKTNDPLRIAIDQLVFEASHVPYDSARTMLANYPFDSLSVPWSKFYIWDPVRIKIPTLPQAGVSVSDSLMTTDSSFVTSPFNSQRQKDLLMSSLTDTSVLVVLDTIHIVTPAKDNSPIKYFTFPYQSDSIKVAVQSLLKYLEVRDSSIVYFEGASTNITPVWLNSKSDKIMRYWLKNDFNDSVTVWFGSTGRDTLGIYLEKGVAFKRPDRQVNYSDARIDLKQIDKSTLLESQKIVVKPQYWKYRSEASFVFSQSALSNWVKGGENSVSTALDVTGYADYNNKKLKLSSNNFARLKLGFLKSGTNPARKNLDLLETNSKLNHKAFGKFDFSAIFLFKSQIAPGYNYTKVAGRDTAILVSKLFNPIIITAGLGLDYKPNKQTSINLSPFSYKGTFVRNKLIDETKYGIPEGKTSLNEPGASFMISNEYKPFKNLTLTNRLQLFTNYIHNPLNIDVDWEMIAVANLNWFTDVRFNTHLIFDDDTKTGVMEDGNPVHLPDGTQKKTARIQFKELLGFSLVFRF